MTFSRFSYYKHIYIELLPIFVPTTTFIGFIGGLVYQQPAVKPLDYFINTIGHTTIGIITGLTYPISYPLIGAYVLCKHVANKPQPTQ